ncbi:MAG: hypothetical protein ACFB50_17645 [Rubrobacteraceae bacterium]
MAKRGYNRDTIRGGASDWDVSRPVSSYLRLLASLLAHPARFFEVLPRIPDIRAPGLFLAFSGFPAAVFWVISGGVYPAILALLAPLPLSFAVAGLYHLGSLGGRYGYVVTWRTVAYPLGFYLPLSAVPVLRWVAGFYAGVVLLSIGLRKVQETSAARAISTSVAVTLVLVLLVFGVRRVLQVP